MSSGCGAICAQCDCHVFHQYTLLVPANLRDGLVAHLQSLGVPSGVYYPIPLHRQKAYLSERYNEADFEVTNRISEQVISLPMHTELDEEQQTYIAQSLTKFLCTDG